MPQWALNPKVLSQLKAQGKQERCVSKIIGHKVCQRSFRMLLGLGKRRMQRLRNAILNNEAFAPC